MNVGNENRKAQTDRMMADNGQLKELVCIDRPDAEACGWSIPSSLGTYNAQTKH